MLVFSKERGGLGEGDDPVAKPYVPVDRDQAPSHQVDKYNSRWSTVIRRISQGKYHGRIERFSSASC